MLTKTDLHIAHHVRREMNNIKRKSHAFGKDIYFLGQDKDGINYWLEEAKWDCDWYWGGGYVETYTNNKCPSMSRDINSHSHFNCMFFKGNKNGYDAFKDFFVETPFTDKEIWTICELLKAFYIARDYSDMICRGGAHYTTNPAKETIKNDAEYKRINEIVIPEIMRNLYKIMTPERKDNT